MDPEVKSKWTAALRSGDYKQARKVLRTVEDRFCCLGVLCELLGPDGWNRDSDGAWDHDGNESMPTGAVEVIAGIDETEAEKLAELNDDGRSFLEIADYIEKNL